MSDFIYHVVLPDYWKQFKGKDTFTPPTFQEEGFIHCCTKEQIEYVLTTYFVGVEEIVLLKLATDLLTAKVLIEPANGQEFPHIYGPINRKAIIGVEKINQ